MSTYEPIVGDRVRVVIEGTFRGLARNGYQIGNSDIVRSDLIEMIRLPKVGDIVVSPGGLDALPTNSVVKAEGPSSAPAFKVSDRWYYPARSEPCLPEEVSLPATILWLPGVTA